MAINISSAAATAACNSIVDLVDVGTAGFMRLYNAGGTIGVTIPFSATAFGGAAVSAASGNASCVVPISATCAIASCTLASFTVFNSATVTIWAGICSTAAGVDLVFSNLAAVTGDTIVITALNFIVGATAV
jgi:hypothetical protein